nr:hypothetical protein [Mycobacterium sp. 852002-40037_SCH5390672]
MLDGDLAGVFALVRQVGQITPHSGGGVVRLDPHIDQSLNDLVRGHGRTDVVIDHMKAGKPILCGYSRWWGLRIAPYALNVTIDASVSVSRRRTHRHSNGDADRRSGVDETHAGIIPCSPDLTNDQSEEATANQALDGA